MVEVSISAGNAFNEPEFRAGLVVNQTVRSTLKDELPIVAKVHFEDSLAGDWEGALRKAVKTACLEVRSLENSSSKGTRSATANFGRGRVEIEELNDATEPIPFGESSTPKEDQYWTSANRVSLARPPQGGLDYHAIDDPDKFEVARIFIHIPKGETPDVYTAILKKFKKEARQLHGVRQPRVVILDVSSLEENALDLDLKAIHAGFSKALRDTPELACIWLVSRVWTTASRFRYQGVLVPNETAECQLPTRFLGKLVELEHNWDILGDKPRPNLNRDEAQRDYRERSR